MNRKTILIIDASGSLCASIQHIFSHTGANVVMVHDEADGLFELNHLQPDLIVIDVELSPGSDLDFLHNIRRVTSIPIIVVTGIDARGQSRFFDAGADDVVTKPLNMEILLARIKATLRRAGTQVNQRETALYDDGNLVFDPAGYQTVVGGSWVRLTPTEFKLLAYLVRNAGVSCTFRQILKNVWGDAFKNNREYVHLYIWQLRQKLERNPKEPEYIVSVYNIGYRFQAHEYGQIARTGQVRLPSPSQN